MSKYHCLDNPLNDYDQIFRYINDPALSKILLTKITCYWFFIFLFQFILPVTSCCRGVAVHTQVTDLASEKVVRWVSTRGWIGPGLQAWSVKYTQHWVSYSVWNGGNLPKRKFYLFTLTSWSRCPSYSWLDCCTMILQSYPYVASINSLFTKTSLITVDPLRPRILYKTGSFDSNVTFWSKWRGKNAV